MQPELTLYTSNRLDVLVRRLATVMAEHPLSPLEREILVVQSQGMQRWITLQLARRHGIAGSLNAVYPRPFCHWLARRLETPAEDSPELSEGISNHCETLFDRDLLTWQIFHRLGADPQAAGAAAAAYLADDSDQRKRLQLSARLADLMDQYQMFRPDMLAAWEARRQLDWDNPEHQQTAAWQAGLWRRLALRNDPSAPDSFDDQPLHRRLSELIQRLNRPPTGQNAKPEGLPSRVTVVGVSSLPPVFVDLLCALARHVPVAVYFVSPTYHYWGDLRSEKETARLARRLKIPPEQLLDEQHFQQGHPLLAALGRQGRDFFNLLQVADPSGSAWQDLDFTDPGTDTALHVLQHDILHLVERPEVEPLILDPRDRSLEVHVCHSPMREMEVLRDRLLDALAHDPELRPGDILVQVPDIELYGPYIQAVFGVDHAGSPRLPFSIADRRAGREQPLSEVFLRLFQLVGERLTVRQVFDLLDVPAVRRRFQLSADEIPTLRRLVDDVRIRWAMDGAQKSRDFDLPAWDANTWKAGLERLVMGYAVGSSERLVNGIAPYAGDTAGTADSVGRLAAWVDKVFQMLRGFAPDRTLPAWAELITETLDDLFEAEGESEERALQWLRDALSDLRRLGLRLDLSEAISYRAMSDHLTALLGSEGFGSGFIDGRMTFCALKPMRTIPFRVVCIAGLNDGAFPRRDRHRSFDLMAAEPKAGDRSLRDDDRYLFLETLIAARHKLILTYVGRSQKDSSSREPSVVLSELLDQVDRSFRLPEALTAARPGLKPRQVLTTEHPLQAWSPSYFGAPEPLDGAASAAATPSTTLASYARENARAVQALRSPRRHVPRFAEQELPGADEQLLDPHGNSELELRLDDLQRFWELPCRAYCRRTLGVSLELEELQDHETEPFSLSGLEAFDLRHWLLRRRLTQSADASSNAEGAASNRDGAESRELVILRAEGKLPALELGNFQWRRQSRRVDMFLDRVPDHAPKPPRVLDVRGLGSDLGFRITGTLRSETTDGLLMHHRVARLRAVDQLRVWIELLVAAFEAEQQQEPAPEALLVGEDAVLRMTPPINAEALVADLVEDLRQGLRRPLPFFAEASYAFAKQREKIADPRNRIRRSPLDVARQKFESRSFRRRVDKESFPGDADNPYVRLAFRGLDPLEDPDFERLAERLWKPIFDATREEA